MEYFLFKVGFKVVAKDKKEAIEKISKLHGKATRITGIKFVGEVEGDEIKGWKLVDKLVKKNANFYKFPVVSSDDDKVKGIVCDWRKCK